MVEAGDAKALLFNLVALLKPILLDELFVHPLPSFIPARQINGNGTKIEKDEEERGARVGERLL